MNHGDPRNWLVAHRGHASICPENSLSALRSAVGHGMRLLEFDLQFTADDVPVVLHDPDLRRTGGVSASVLDLCASDLSRYHVGYPDRFGSEFAHEPLLPLASFVEFFEAYPQVTPVVEIKGESARAKGVDRAVERVLDVLAPILPRCVLISFVERVVLSARRLGAPRVGWCLSYYDTDSERVARCLEPEFLLVDYRLLPADDVPLWPGPWQWMAWEVTDVELALSLRARGVDFIETMAGGELLADARLAKR